MKPGMGVYIHIPFCIKKCLYCDFPSFAGRQGRYEAYKNALIKELEASEELAEAAVETVYIGGGTPTALPAGFLGEILEAASKRGLEAGAEVSVEANPGTLTKEKLEVLRSCGANRLSIGMQAKQDRLLKALGRIHGWDDFLASWELALKAGFENMNVDIMFCLPGQTMDDWRETLCEIARLLPRHVSAYSLSVEEGTAFFELQRTGKLKLPSEEEDRAMFAEASLELGKIGLRQYEISNFAVPGSESRHNCRYWKREGTLGFGLGAHSFWNGDRWRNSYDLNEYVRSAGQGRKEGLARPGLRESMEEAMFLGLRLNEGVSAEKFKAEFGLALEGVFGSAIHKMAALGLMENSGSRVFLTDKGRDLSNAVFLEFLLD
ncbi:MAG: radical SAM family heme chaperone HemW [Clostridiales bacterium]|jgi:oxygen-independent coproporphyrinogen-3 oxidase|nr:radical SAM family heme chaperone HemW [Clostridiales bacterium]